MYVNYICIILYTSHHFTPHGRYEVNKLTSLPMCGFIAQLVEQRTGNADVTGSSPDFFFFFFFFFRLLLSNCLNWKVYCDDHSSLSKKCIMPSSRERLKGIIGRGHDLRLRLDIMLKFLSPVTSCSRYKDVAKVLRNQQLHLLPSRILYYFNHRDRTSIVYRRHAV